MKNRINFCRAAPTSQNGGGGKPLRKPLEKSINLWIDIETEFQESRLINKKEEGG